MHFRALIGWMPILCFLSSTAWASPVVTEAELLSQLDRDHPSVVAAQGQLDLARAQQFGARTFENPTLEFGREDPSGDLALTEWIVSWQLPAASRSLDLAAADQSVEAAEAHLGHQLRSIRLRVREDYAGWALAHRRFQLLQSEASRFEALAVRERSRAERGESSGLEARRLELAAVTLRAKVALATSDLQEAQAAVRVWWPGLAPEAQPELPDPLVRASADAASTLAQTHPLSDEHPLVKASRAETEAADLALRANQRFLVAPELSLGWQRQEAFQQDESGPIIRLAWSLPFFDRRQSKRAAAQAHLDRTRANTAMASRDIETRRQVAIQRLADLLKETSAVKTALDASRDMLLSAETAFRYGELPLTDLLDIQRSMTETQIAWLELYGAALEAHRELDALAPALPSEVGGHPELTHHHEESHP